MFRRRHDDEDPFAALKEAAERGSTHVVGGARPASDDGERRADPRSPALGDRPATPQVPGPLGPPRSRRGSDRLLALLFVVLALGGAGALVWQSERDAEQQAAAAGRLAAEETSGDAASERRDATSGGDHAASRSDHAAGGGDEGVRDAEAAPRRLDLVRPAGFARAVRRIRAELRPGERVTLLRVARERIDAQTARRDGRQRTIDVADDLSVTAREAGDAGSRTAIPLDRIDPGAPSRSIRGAVARGGMPASRFDYMVMVGLPAVFRAPPTWSLFFEDVAQRDYHWRAPLSGAPVTRPGEAAGGAGATTGTSTSSSVTITRDGKTTTLTGADAQRISRCIRQAGTDGAAIQRCLP